MMTDNSIEILQRSRGQHTLLFSCQVGGAMTTVIFTRATGELRLSKGLRAYPDLAAALAATPQARLQAALRAAWEYFLTEAAA